jgi:hypothetical protein
MCNLVVGFCRRAVLVVGFCRLLIPKLPFSMENNPFYDVSCGILPPFGDKTRFSCGILPPFENQT